MLWQETQAEVDYLYINDLDPDDEHYQESSAILFDKFREEIKVENTPIERPPGAEYFSGEDTTHWQEATFGYLAQLRNRLIQATLEGGYDYLFMVDTDLLLDPRTLQSLIECRQPIVSGVFWTQWMSNAPFQPQVWLHHPYGLQGRGYEEHEFIKKLSDRQLTQVWGLGACTLFSREVLEAGLNYDPLPDLPSGGMWQGEDRHFSVKAERAHIPMHADAWPDIYHVYRPSDDENIEQAMNQLREPKQVRAKVGDMVSMRLSPLQEPNLGEYSMHLRGRVGQIECVPELEVTMLDMKVGDDRLMQISFPYWYPIDVYRNQKRTVRVEMLDIRPHRPHIGIPFPEQSETHSFYDDAQMEVMADATVSS
jgi:hypothetical protein